VLLGTLERELEGQAERVFLLTGRDTPAEAFYRSHGYRAERDLTAMIKDL